MASIVIFGGKEFPLRAPGLSVYAEILDAVMAVRDLGEDASERAMVKTMVDQALFMLEHWDGAIGENRDWIKEHGTPNELIAFFAKAAHVVSVPLESLPGLLDAAGPNRAAKRAKAKAKPNSKAAPG